MEACFHRQFVDLRFRQLLQFARCGGAIAGNCLRFSEILLSSSGELFAQSAQDLFAVLNIVEFLLEIGAKCDDFFHAAAVFSLQPVNDCETIFDFGQALRRSLNTVGVVARSGANVLDIGACRLNQLKRFAELGIITRQFFELTRRRTQRTKHRTRRFVEQIVRIHSRGIQFFRVHKHATLAFKAHILAGFQLSGLNFGLLEAPKVD